MTHLFRKILQRNSKGGIQLLCSHLGSEGGTIKMRMYANRGREEEAYVRANVRL